jgi:YecM protein
MDKAEQLGLFIDGAIPLLAAFEEWREDARVGTMNAHADHLSYQCGDSDEYERMRSILELECVFTFQSMIAGRRILLARLHRGLHTKLGEITVFEICDQKPDGSKQRGFDHIEIYPCANRVVLEVRTREDNMAALVRKLNGEFRDPRLGRLPQFDKTGTKANPTYDAIILRREGYTDFRVRVRPEPLLAKIARDEFR